MLVYQVQKNKYVQKTIIQIARVALQARKFGHKDEIKNASTVLKNQYLLHHYINIFLVFKCIIETNKIFMSCQSPQYFYFPSDILNGYGCGHLSKS